MTPEQQSNEAKRAKEALDKIKSLLAFGRISYDAAQEFAAPHLKTLNDHLRAKAKAAGLRFTPVSFTGYMR